MRLANEGQLVFLTIMALAACADPAQRVAGPAQGLREAQSHEAAVEADERAAASTIGRLVALSLADRKMRHGLKKDLRAAPFREHKVELGAYLRSAEGRELLDRMAAHGDLTTDDLLTTMIKVRSVELYMPVRKHRESWTGDGELLVAVQLEQKDPIMAFNSRGQIVAISATVAPAQATISIVGSETRFDRPMKMNAKNIEDRNGQSIGTLVPVSLQASKSMECSECIDGGAEQPVGAEWGGAYLPPGIYLTFSRILDAHEPWNRGDPEIEVHIQGPSDQGKPRVGDDLSCAGEHAYDHRKVFDQNGGFWEGNVMLFSAEETERFNSKFNDGFHVFFWEDDDTSCVLRLDNESLLEFINSTALAVSNVALKAIPLTWRLAATVFIATMFTNPGEWLKTNDDFIGAAVAQEDAGYSYPGNTHVIMIGTQLNGRATMINR